jgi:hypothetical protein
MSKRSCPSCSPAAAFKLEATIAKARCTSSTDVAPVGVDVADQDPPTRVFAGIGAFTPEAQNENLIEQWSL